MNWWEYVRSKKKIEFVCKGFLCVQNEKKNQLYLFRNKCLSSKEIFLKWIPTRRSLLRLAKEAMRYSEIQLKHTARYISKPLLLV